MRQLFRILIADRDEEWASQLCQTLEHQRLLRLDVTTIPFNMTDGSNTLSSVWACTQICNAGIYRPIFRFAPDFNDPLCHCDHWYQSSQLSFVRSFKAVVWMAGEQDHEHPRWEAFVSWAAENKQCVIDETAQWSEFGGAWRVALLASVYLAMRAKVRPAVEPQNILEAKQPRPGTSESVEEYEPLTQKARKEILSRRSLRWALEQELLLNRLRLIQQRDTKILQFDPLAQALADLL